METKQKTLAECKQSIAKKYDFKDFERLVRARFNFNDIDKYYNEAAELYASEENRKKDEPKQSEPEDNNFYCDERYKVGYVCEDGQCNKCKKADELKEPMSADVEETARKQAQEIIDPLISSGFYSGFLACAKWQSQQPVSIQWLSDEEISNAADTPEFNPSGEAAGFEYGIIYAQSELRKRVIDPVYFARIKKLEDALKKCKYEAENAQTTSLHPPADYMMDTIIETVDSVLIKTK